MMRIGQVRLRGDAAMAGLANDTAVQPRRRLCCARGAERSAATRVSPCAARKPGQAERRDCQRQGLAIHQSAAFSLVARAAFWTAPNGRIHAVPALKQRRRGSDRRTPAAAQAVSGLPQ
jgi:hypothetical protein